MNLIADHPTLTLIVAYVLIAAVQSLPDPSQTFECYPWIYHTTRQLLNAVPQQYKPKVPSGDQPQ